MDFVTCCKLHGILIDSVPRMGVWRRYPTEDHPNKRNGAVKFMGDHGFIQNHATETEVSLWKSDDPHKIDRSALMREVRAADLRKEQGQREAASKAAWILDQTVQGKHDYLKRKGFLEDEGRVWPNKGDHLLVIPMRVGGSLVGCQLINREGGKKFLFGQRTSNAELVIDNKGTHVLCEGYATALSIQKSLKSLKRRYTIHVCFSAGNMKKIAADLLNGVVIADNDASGTGERVAKEIGWPYWMSDTVGEDANDARVRMGDFRFGQSLIKSLKIF